QRTGRKRNPSLLLPLTKKVKIKRKGPARGLKTEENLLKGPIQPQVPVKVRQDLVPPDPDRDLPGLDKAHQLVPDPDRGRGPDKQGDRALVDLGPDLQELPTVEGLLATDLLREHQGSKKQSQHKKKSRIK